jgi:hypothetical protein
MVSCRDSTRMTTPTSNPPPALKARKTVVWLSRAIGYLVYFYLIAVEVILLLGFFLLLFGANSTAEFTQWAYRNLERVMQPFRGIFTPIHLGTTNGDVAAVFDTSVLFAMIVYGIIALAISALLSWLTSRLRYLEAAEADAEAAAASAARDQLPAPPPFQPSGGAPMASPEQTWAPPPPTPPGPPI